MAEQAFRCANCGALFEADGRSARCPTCGQRVSRPREERQSVTEQPLPKLPPSRARPAANLEGPAFLDAPKSNKAAPLHEFVAAFVVLVGFALIVAGAATSEGAFFLGGLIVIFITVAVFGVLSFVRTIRALVRAYNQHWDR
jgi:DNA-directed RNA polymerase subunit RPC12/RpoP